MGSQSLTLLSAVLLLINWQLGIRHLGHRSFDSTRHWHSICSQVFMSSPAQVVMPTVEGHDMFVGLKLSIVVILPRQTFPLDAETHQLQLEQHSY